MILLNGLFLLLAFLIVASSFLYYVFNCDLQKKTKTCTVVLAMTEYLPFMERVA